MLSSQLNLDIQIFASLAARLNVERIAIELPSGATAGDLIKILVVQFPDAADFEESLAVAVNHAYVPRDHVLSESDEIALIPPVSGG